MTIINYPWFISRRCIPRVALYIFFICKLDTWLGCYGHDTLLGLKVVNKLFLSLIPWYHRNISHTSRYCNTTLAKALNKRTIKFVIWLCEKSSCQGWRLLSRLLNVLANLRGGGIELLIKNVYGFKRSVNCDLISCLECYRCKWYQPKYEQLT